MKKVFLSFLSLMELGFPAFAQSHINIELLGTTYNTPAVQFRVSWNSIPSVAGETHNSKIWLWVNYIKIENNQPSGTWTRATVANPSPGTVEVGNNNGFWLQGAISGNYNEIVTVQLMNVSEQFNWCAYASDCPPNATISTGTYNNGTYTLKGTKPFIINGSISVNATTYSGGSITSITDATQCPGYRCSLRDEAVGVIGCCAGLTAIGSYCRDLAADNALSICDLEWKKDGYEVVANYSSSNHKCPAGWRPAMYNDMKCAYDSGKWDNDITGGIAADVLNAGWTGGTTLCCTSTNARWRIWNNWGGYCAQNNLCGSFNYGTVQFEKHAISYHVGSMQGRCVR